MAAGRLKIDIRRKRILELLAQNGQVTVAELSGLLNATQTTIRTDLDTMAAENRLVRIPGGAIAMEAAQTAAAKAKELAAVAKANISIYAEEDKVKKAEIELGKLYYRDYAVGEELDSAEYLPWCQKIDESKKAIADLKDYIASLRTEEEPAEAEDAPTDDDFEIVVADEAPKAEEAPEAPKAPAEAAPAEEAPKTEE